MRRCKLQGIVAKLYGKTPRLFLAHYGARGTDPMPVRLFASRVAAGLDYSDMGEKLGVHRTSVMRWETGDIHTMSVEHLRAWARITGVDYEWIVANTGYPGDRIMHYVHVGHKQVKPLIEPLPDELGLVSSREQYYRRVYEDKRAGR